MLLPVLGTLFLAFVLQRALRFWRAAQAIGHWPGYRTLFFQAHPIGNVLPPTKGISPGWHHTFTDKYKIFAEIGWDAYYNVAAFPQSTALSLADAAAIKEVVSSRTRFPKYPPAVLMFFGPNIVASEGDDWKKYKKICAPAFSEPNNKLVWDETVKIIQEMFDVVWVGKDTIEVDHALEITLTIALSVIGVAGFGQTMSWKDEQLIPSGHTMTFQNAIRSSISNIIWKLLIPDWVPSFMVTERIRSVRLAFDELRLYMSEMIDARQGSGESTRHDLFNNLLRANEGDDSGQKLTKDELIGNVFVFLLAGHETTAHTLCFTFGLLALFPEEQDKLYNHINSVFSKTELPTYSQMPLLTQSQAVLNETLRLFPPAAAILKYSAEETSIQIGNKYGHMTTLPIPKKAWVTLNAVGMHHNPRYWDEPDTFNPDRFLKDWPRDAFIPFSAGHRACLGKRFFETEAIAALSIIISRYKIEVKEELQFSGESFEQRYERVLHTKQNITLTPTRVPLVFRKRD